EHGCSVAGASRQFRMSPLSEGGDVPFAASLEDLDNPEIHANFAQPNVLFVGSRAHLLRGAGQQFKMTGLDLTGRKADGGLEALRERLGGDGNPHRTPLADRKLHQSRDRNSENEKGDHGVAREPVSRGGMKYPIEQAYYSGQTL